MELVLTDPQPCHANFCTREGQVIYKVSSPIGLVGRTITIDKVVAPSSSDSKPSNTRNSGEPGLAMDSFAPVARIDYAPSLTVNSKFHFFESEPKAGAPEGKFNTMTADGIFKRGNILRGLWYGSDRIFVGPDGREYVWVLGMMKPALFLNDGSKTPIAKFHRPHHGSKDKEPVQPSLEIFEGGLHMVDLIIVTFVYVEKMRKDRERGWR